MFHHGISLRLEASATKVTKLVLDDIAITTEANRLGISEEEYKNSIKQKEYDKKVNTVMNRYSLSLEDATARVNDEEAARIERLKRQYMKYKESIGQSIAEVDENDSEFESYCIEIGEGTEGLYKKSYIVTEMTVPYIQYNFDAAKTGRAETGKFNNNVETIDHLADPDELKRLFKVYSEAEEFTNSVNYITDIMKEELKIKVMDLVLIKL